MVAKKPLNDGDDLDFGAYRAPESDADDWRSEGGQETDHEMEFIRREHIKHEASVKSLGSLCLFGAVIGVLYTIGLFVVYFFAEVDNARMPVPKELFLFFAVAAAGFSILYFWLGIGLRQLNNAARIVFGVLMSISVAFTLFSFAIQIYLAAAMSNPNPAGGLVGVPISLAISIYCLYLVFSQKGRMVFSPEYKEIIERTPHVKYRSACGVVLVVLLVLFVLLILIAVIAGVSSTQQR